MARISLVAGHGHSRAARRLCNRSVCTGPLTLLLVVQPSQWRFGAVERDEGVRSQARVLFGAVHTLALLEASRSVVKAEGADRRDGVDLALHGVSPADPRVGSYPLSSGAGRASGRSLAGSKHS